MNDCGLAPLTLPRETGHARLDTIVRVFTCLIAVCVLAGAVSAVGAGHPAITSVAFKGSAAQPAFVLTGRNFGTRPHPSQPPNSSSACLAENPNGNTGLNFGNRLYLHDLTNNLSAGLSGPFAGTPNVIDCVGLLVATYRPTRVAYSLGSDYKAHPYSINEGDRVTFVIASAHATVRVRYGKTITVHP